MNKKFPYPEFQRPRVSHREVGNRLPHETSLEYLCERINRQLHGERQGRTVDIKKPARAGVRRHDPRWPFQLQEYRRSVFLNVDLLSVAMDVLGQEDICDLLKLAQPCAAEVGGGARRGLLS